MDVSIRTVVQSYCFHGTVDGRNPANWLRLVVYHTVDRVSYIPGGAGFLPFAVQKRNQSTTPIDPLPNMHYLDEILRNFGVLLAKPHTSETNKKHQKILCK